MGRPMTNTTNALRSSVTTGPASLASAASNAIGRLLSATPAVSASVKLAELRPADTDRRVADALEHISGQRPVFRRRNMFPENGPMYQITEAVGWTCDESQVKAALVAVEFSLRAAPGELIAKALYELRTLTRGRANREAGDDEAEALIFAERLGQYPADIVLDTLKNWPARSDGQWWPTWHDLLAAIEPQTATRRLLADHIRNRKCLPAPQQPVDAPLTAEDLARRAELAARARERFGIKSTTGETVVDRDALPAAKRVELDKAMAATVARIASSGLPMLSDEALATCGMQRSRPVDEGEAAA